MATVLNDNIQATTYIGSRLIFEEDNTIYFEKKTPPVMLCAKPTRSLLPGEVVINPDSLMANINICGDFDRFKTLQQMRI